MPDRKPIPVGTEEFKELVDKEYCFVDKTLLIKSRYISEKEYVYYVYSIQRE